MPWTKVTMEIDADKLGAGRPESAYLVATFTYPDSSTWDYRERADSSTLSGYAARAKAALSARDSKRSRESAFEASILTQLNT